VRAGSLSQANEACFAGMAGEIESNAVPVADEGAIWLIQWVKISWKGIGPNTTKSPRPKTRQDSNDMLKI